MNNQDLRSYAKRHGVFLWELAEKLGTHESMLSRKLRHELPDDEKKKMFALIDEIATEESHNG